MMKNRVHLRSTMIVAFTGGLLVVSALAQTARTAAASAPQTQPSPPATLASVVDHDISGIEKMVVEAAEAMPEDKFNFSPESLNIPGNSFTGVRTFALQVKHVAASNYAIWAPLTGDTFPKDYMGGNGPENLKTKADIINFLKDSFALGHKAAATLTSQNMLETVERQIDTRAPGQLRRCPRMRSLRTDGGVSADERNCATCEPGKIRLSAD